MTHPASNLNFDATTVAPSSPMEPVPNGWYRIHFIESDVKRTANGKGFYLQLTGEILDGEYKGRKYWERLNIQNENATAQEIAQRTLSAICHATGVLKLSHSSQLHHKPLMAKLAVTKDDGYEPKNEAKGYKAVEGGAGVKPPAHGNTAFGAQQTSAIVPPQNGAPPASAPPTEIVPPWAQKKAS